MEKAIEVIKELQKEGVIKDYAVGGGIAVIVYVEPILTYDLDIFFVPRREVEGVITLSPIYDWFRKRGYQFDKEHIIIDDIPVQFIPVYNKLVEDAVNDAVDVKYKDAKVRVLRAEYLIAIMLQIFRSKDKERIIKLKDETRIDELYLRKILQKHGLEEKFDNFIELYYGE